MSKHLTLAVLALAMVALAVGCGDTTKVFIRKDAEPINVETEKLLILPVDAWGFAGEGISDLEITGALVAGTAGAFGKNALALQPFKDPLEKAGFTGMARKLAWGTYHMMTVHNENYDLASDSCAQGIEKVPSIIATLVAKAAELLGLDFQPRYIFALGLNGTGKGKMPGTMGYRVIATIYDKEKKLVHSCTYYTGSAPAGKAALAKIQGIPKEAFKILMPIPEEPAEEGGGDEGGGDEGGGDEGGGDEGGGDEGESK